MEKNNINIDLNAKTKSKEERNVPNLRFNKYHNEYELLQLNKTLKIKSGKDQKQVQIEDGQYNIYGTGGIIGKTNTFLYDKPSVGIGRKGTIDKPVYFDKPFWTVDTLFYSEINNGFVPKYIYYTFQTINWRKYNTSTGVPSLTSSSIEHIEKSFPCYDEQLEIASFLTLIDNRISTQIKIIEDLKVLKKSIINQFLFNEQIKCNQIYLKDILVERNLFCIKDDTFPHATLSKDGIHPKSERYDRDFLVKNSDKKYKVSYLNDICYNPANLKFGVIALNKLGPCIISPIYVTYSIKSGYNPKLLEMIMTNERFINKARKYEQGTVYERMSVSSSDMLSLKIAIPPFDIQEKIIKYINSLDIKIKVETSLYNLYLKQKEYLLNNLFI